MGRVTSLAVLCLLPPLLLAGLLSVAVDRGFWSTTVRTHQAAVLEQHGGCYGYVALTDTSDDSCTLNPSDGRPIYLVGDSHAHHFTEAVQSAGESLDRPVIVSTATNCPVVDVALQHTTAPPAHNSSCRSFVRGTLEYLDDAPPGVVVMAASDRYWTDDDFSIGLSPGTMSEGSADKLQLAEVATISTVERIQSAGHRVLLVEDVPRWDGVDEWSPVDCTVISLLLPVGSCERQMPLSRFRDRQGAAREVLRSVAAATGSETLDLSEKMCPEDWCTNRSDGLTSYRDSNHITVSQSLALGVDFLSALQDASGP